MPLTSRQLLPRRARPDRPRRRRRALSRHSCGLGLSVAALAAPATGAALAASAPAVAARGCAHAHLMPTRGDMALVAQAIACLVNARRSAAGLPPLAPDPALNQAARAHSLSMVERVYFSHTGPWGLRPEQRMRAAGYSCRGGCPMGENIAWGSGGYATASSIVSFWMRSAPHRANILGRGFRREGIGAVMGAPARGWRRARATTVTQDFGAGG